MTEREMMIEIMASGMSPTNAKAPTTLAERALDALTAAGYTVERPTPKATWYADAEGSYECPDDALEGHALGETIGLDECAVIDSAKWQLVPVTVEGDLCPCGKVEGCGDFLGVECEADRDKARRWDDLPEEWRR